jgi:hypothetical protein
MYACSWLQKLQLAKKVLVDDAPRPDLDALAFAFIYLQVSHLRIRQPSI